MYRPRIHDGKNPAANRNTADIIIPQMRLTSKLHQWFLNYFWQAECLPYSGYILSVQAPAGHVLRSHPKAFLFFRVRTYIYSNLSDPDLNRSSIAEYLHMSQDYLSYVFHQKFNQTLSAYITSMRIDKAKELLERTNCGMDINCRKNWIFQQLLLS